MRKQVSYLVCLILLFCFVSLAKAQTQDLTGVQALQVTKYATPIYNQYVDNNSGVALETLVVKAKELNKELEVARQNIAIIKGRIIQAGLKPNPTLEAEVLSDQLGTREGEYQFSVTYSKPIELAGKRNKRIKIAQLELAQAEKEVAFQEQQLVSEIYLQYAQTIGFLENLRTLERLIVTNEETARIVNARFKEGDAAKLDITLTKTEVNRLHTQRLQTEINIRTSLTKLKALVGLSLEEPLKLQNIFGQISDVKHDLQGLQKLALATRIDLKAAQIAEELAQAKIDLAVAEAKPDISIFGRYQESKSIFDTVGGKLVDTDRQLGFGVSIPLATSNRNQGNIAEATALKIQNSRRRELLEQLIKRDVALAYGKLDMVKESLRFYEKEVLPNSQKTLNVIRVAYDLGEQQLLDVIAEQRRLIEIQQQYIEVQKDYYISLMELEKALGIRIN